MARKKATPAGITGPVHSIREALDKVELLLPRPADTDPREPKQKYAVQLSRHFATLIAHALRPDFDGILPKENGEGQESPSRARRALKNLDVNYSTIVMGLGLGVSIKTINFKDAGTGRFTKNYSSRDNELRAEATDYHLRQPYAVLVAIIFLPIESCDDGGKGKGSVKNPSSFAEAVNYFRLRAGRSSPTSDVELFERVFVGLYHHRGQERGSSVFFDVVDHPPPRARRPRDGEGINFPTMIASIRQTYDQRNNPPPVYLDD